jgi:phospholipid/cholesterol/gamma-HCH transport system ATP-binding protein
MGVLVKLIKTVNRALHLTSIVVSHDVHETTSIADYIYLIADGKVVDQGTPEYLYEHETASAWAQQFLEALPDGPVQFHYQAEDYAEDLFGFANNKQNG